MRATSKVIQKATVEYTLTVSEEELLYIKHRINAADSAFMTMYTGDRMETDQSIEYRQVEQKVNSFTLWETIDNILEENK